MQLPDFVAVGDVMVDVVVPVVPMGVHAPIRLRAGGSAVNAASAAVACGASAAVAGRVGSDAAAALIRAELAARGIEARLGVDADTPTGTFVQFRDSIAADRGANARVEATDVDVTGARCVLVSGYQLFQRDSGPATARALDADARVAVDLASARLLAGFSQDELRALLDKAEVVVGSADATALLPELRDVVVVTTLGADGAEAGGIRVAPPRALRQDAVGAGDRFAAGLLVALASGADLEQALTAGCAAAAS